MVQAIDPFMRGGHPLVGLIEIVGCLDLMPCLRRLRRYRKCRNKVQHKKIRSA